MEINKPTYITDLTTEIMNNLDLLKVWAKHSVDMEFLELSVDILSDIDLLFIWDCDNVIQAKLAGLLSGNQDFIYKDGILIKIDESYDFPFRTSLEYEFCIKEMMDMKSLYELHKKDLVKQGVSLSKIKQDERYLKMASFFHFYEMTKEYELDEAKYLIELTLPDLIERKNEIKKKFKEKKVNELISLNNRELQLNINRIERTAFNYLEEPAIEEKKISMKTIALLNWYNGISITRDNASEIAKSFGHISKLSGEGLYQDYIFYSNNTDRLASGESNRKAKNKIKLFETVVNLLTNREAKSKAETELKILKSKANKYK
jgi:hypothetical protein